MKAVIGLGNPGKQYEKTRHNVGFLVIDRLAERAAAAELGSASFKSKFKADYLSVNLAGQDVLLVKPQGYMNLSGEAIRSILGYFKFELRGAAKAPGLEDRVLVVHDDLDLPFGQLRFRGQGGSGGHNGIQSTIDHLGTRQFGRLKFGIGRDERVEASSYVLAPFGAGVREELGPAIERAAEAVTSWVRSGLRKSSDRFNVREKAKKSDAPSAGPGSAEE